jgi:hypothetical protein
MITFVLVCAAAGFIVLVWAYFRVLLAIWNFCDWWERGCNDFGLPFDEFIRLRIAAGTLRLDGKRWTGEDLASRVR